MLDYEQYDQLDNLTGLFEAFKEGKTIQVWDNEMKKWFDLSTQRAIINSIQCGLHRLRIKPDEPENQYRPYKSMEEFCKDSKEHGPWILFKKTNVCHIPCNADNNRVYFVSSGKFSSWQGNYSPMEYYVILEDCEWQDGTPCGVLIETNN